MSEPFFGANAETSYTFKSVHDALWAGNSSPTVAGAISVATQRHADKELTPAECYAYSVATRRATEAIAKNVAAAKGRVYTESGREVARGPLISLMKRPTKFCTFNRLVNDLVLWWLVRGELAARIEGGSEVTGLRALNPYKLHIKDPTEGMVTRREEVIEWEYWWRQKDKDTIPDAELVWEAMYNPFDKGIRGLSPLVTGSTQAGISYFASRYNKTALANDCIPQGMLVLPEGTPRSQREVLEQKFFSEFGSNKFDQNYRRMMVTSGGDVEFKPFEQPYKDAWFLEAQKWADEKIGQLFGVPPIVMQNLEKTRFDTATEELRHFHENTIAPIVELLTQVLQIQLVDPYFARKGHATVGGDDAESAKGKDRMSKGLGERFEKARAIAEGKLVILLDLDTVPTMASVKASTVEAAEKFRSVTMFSPRAVNEYFSLEADDPKNDKFREDIWAENKFINISNPEMNAKLVPGVEGSGSGESGGNAGAKPTPKKELSSKQKTACKKYMRLLRRLRERSLAAVDANAMWGLREADDDAQALFASDNRKVWQAIRNIRDSVRRHVCNEDLGPDDRKEAVRDYFNGLSTRPSIRSTLGF